MHIEKYFAPVKHFLIINKKMKGYVSGKNNFSKFEMDV